jgi:hypothetical protein
MGDKRPLSERQRGEASSSGANIDEIRRRSKKQRLQEQQGCGNQDTQAGTSHQEYVPLTHKENADMQDLLGKKPNELQSYLNTLSYNKKEDVYKLLLRYEKEHPIQPHDALSQPPTGYDQVNTSYQGSLPEIQQPLAAHHPNETQRVEQQKYEEYLINSLDEFLEERIGKKKFISMLEEKRINNRDTLLFYCKYIFNNKASKEIENKYNSILCYINELLAEKYKLKIYSRDGQFFVSSCSPKA